MNKIQILTQAIKDRSQIEYGYFKNGESEGKRIGNPHVLYVFVAKDGSKSTKCDIFQISGGTESGKLTTFKMCNLDGLENIEILDTKFEENDTQYNPESGVS